VVVLEAEEEEEEEEAEEEEVQQLRLSLGLHVDQQHRQVGYPRLHLRLLRRQPFLRLRALGPMVEVVV
jgi:hypothetical protein